jgi:hypothetical protein
MRANLYEKNGQLEALMAVFLREELQDDTPRPTAQKKLLTDICFYCAGSLFGDREKSTGGVVAWSGNELIGLHQICAEKLGVHLIQDARSLITKTGKYSGDRRERRPRDASTVWYVKDYRNR